MIVVPGYWMNETSGVLAPVVRKYLAGRELDDTEISTMRAYLRQWIAGDFYGPDVDRLRRDVIAIDTNARLRAWLSLALDYEIDPL